MNAATVRTLAAFAAVLVGVFAVAWLLGDRLGPAPAREHSGGSMEGHR